MLYNTVTEACSNESGNKDFAGNTFDPSDIQIFTVGEKNDVLALPQTGGYFELSDCGAFIKVTFDKPAQWEIDQFEAGKPFEIRFIKLNGIIFMLMKFGSLHWIEFPYSVHLSKSLTHIEDMPEGVGYLTTILFSDCSGYLYHIRAVGLSSKFSNALNQAVLEQLQEPIDMETFLRKTFEVQSKYSTKQLVKMSTHYYKSR